jgi:hypothetical protein
MLGISACGRLFLVAILLAGIATGVAAESRRVIVRVVRDSKGAALATARQQLKSVEPIGDECGDCFYRIHVTKRPDGKWLARVIRHSK